MSRYILVPSLVKVRKVLGAVEPVESKVEDKVGDNETGTEFEGRGRERVDGLTTI